MKTILEIKGLTGGYLPDVNILQGIDLELHEGEAVGIIGLNGSGKSTLGKAIMNMIPYRKGEIIYNGKSVTSLSTSELARMGIAIMQQGGQVFNRMSVWDNLQIAFQGQKDNTYISELASIIPLLQEPKKKLQGKRADKLSGGQRQQLALAMTLAQKPQLLILDEPSAGLSPKAIDEMYEISNQIRNKFNTTILLIEQNIYKIVVFCNYHLAIQQGFIAQKDTKEIESIIFKNKNHENNSSIYSNINIISRM